MKKEIPIDWFVCPVSKEPLTKKNNTLTTPKYTYSKISDVWNFIPDGISEFSNENWKTWEKLQANGMVSYEQAPNKNLGVGKRTDFLQFAKFCNFNGLILDIGVGPQKKPSHLDYCQSKKDLFFIGIDPLIGVQPRDFSFVLGLGEYLPFRDKLFDQILYVTSLDHFIDPVITLQEAKRTIKDHGEICIWIGEKDKYAPKPKISEKWYDKLIVPKGAEDPFHFKRFSSQEFERYLRCIQLKVVRKEEHIIDKWRKNLFYKVSK